MDSTELRDLGHEIVDWLADYLAICPVNFRTRLEDMDELFSSLRDECKRATGSVP